MVKNSEKQLVNTIFQYRIGLTFKHKTSLVFNTYGCITPAAYHHQQAKPNNLTQGFNTEVKVLTLQSVYKVQQN